MSSKISHRQQKMPKKPRNLIARDMILRGGGTPMKDRRDKRRSNPNRQEWTQDY